MRRPSAEGGEQGPEQAVTGEQRRARFAVGGLRQAGVFQRHEQADVAGTGIESAEESDQQQRPKGRLGGEGEAGEGHEQGRREEQTPMLKTMAPGAHRQGGRGGAQQSGAGEEAYLPSIETQRQQVDRQQHRHVAVGEGPQSAPHEERQHMPVRAFGKQQPAHHKFRDKRYAPVKIVTKQKKTRQRAQAIGSIAAGSALLRRQPATFVLYGLG